MSSMKTCTKCGVEKKLSDFWNDRRRAGGKQARCKVCRAAETRAYFRSHPEINKERYAREKSQARERHLVRKYGLSEAMYVEMLRKQNGCCAICGAAESEQFKGVLHVDHCHSTGKVRGLLCRGCNHMLGSIRDEPGILLKAVEYLVGAQVAQEMIAAYMECRP